jgi:hypothetical protein
MHSMRRCHLFLGLLLLPWALLYGVTGFLFNHPAIFNDQPLTYYGSREMRGTSLEQTATPEEIAQEVVEALKKSDPANDYRLLDASKPKYVREYAFAVINTENGSINVLFEVDGGGGTITKPKAREPQKRSAAPFERKSGVKVESPLSERFREALPTILQRSGYNNGEITITSVPDLQFSMDYQGKPWIVSFNALKGTVTAKPAEAESATETSLRKFLLPLHKAHGYPGSITAKWWWALVVDIMSGVLVFWALSGILMWWQVKAARLLGGILLILGTICAAYLALSMNALRTP